jgi:putative hydrolase of the HAD superfamily
LTGPARSSTSYTSILEEIVAANDTNQGALQVIRKVIFDYGQVLCHPADRNVVENMRKMFCVDEAGFWQLYDRNREGLDRGDLSPDEYWSRFASDCGMTIDDGQMRWLRTHDIEMWSHPNDDMFDWAEALRSAGYQTCILSNLNREFTAHLRGTCDWVKRFDVQIFSSEIGKIKPDPEIYRHCLQLLNCTASEALFLDDRIANVTAARREGITSLVYRSTDQLKSDLQAMGWSPLPSVIGQPAGGLSPR